MDKQTNKPLYIITGATDAMGSVVTQNLAEAGHAIVMACFDTERAMPRLRNWQSAHAIKTSPVCTSTLALLPA